MTRQKHGTTVANRCKPERHKRSQVHDPFNLLNSCSMFMPRLSQNKPPKSTRKESANHLLILLQCGVRFSSHTFLIVPSLLLHLNTPHSSATPPAPQALQAAHLLIADLEAAFVRLAPSRAHNPPHHASKAPQLFHALCGLGIQHLGHFWPYRTRERKEKNREEEKTWNSTSHFNWRELWWRGTAKENMEQQDYPIPEASCILNRV